MQLFLSRNSQKCRGDRQVARRSTDQITNNVTHQKSIQSKLLSFRRSCRAVHVYTGDRQVAPTTGTLSPEGSLATETRQGVAPFDIPPEKRRVMKSQKGTKVGFGLPMEMSWTRAGPGARASRPQIPRLCRCPGSCGRDARAPSKPESRAHARVLSPYFPLFNNENKIPFTLRITI
jgi:hypothetical protein